MMTAPVFDVSGAVAILNQTLEYAYPSITIVGELSQFQVSKNKWVYFDIKDEQSKLRCFGSVWQLKTALEDGMQIEVVAQPRLHNLYGFSLNIQSVRPVGEGSLKKAADLLYARLEKEGLFAYERKRILPYPPEKISLVASWESAAYADFIKIIKARWPHIEITHYDVSVQGALAEEELVWAIAQANQQVDTDVLVMIRGGGSADDLAAFSTETVTRAIAMSRLPTIVAIGHETDVSLAELAADVRASTPSNAAELLVPDAPQIEKQLAAQKTFIFTTAEATFEKLARDLKSAREDMDRGVDTFMESAHRDLEHARLRLSSYHPDQVLKRGYALVRSRGKLLQPDQIVQNGDALELELVSSIIDTTVIRRRNK